MAKTLISAEPGALMKVAKLKGLSSIKALSEKTGSDRKTLKAINEGRPVKDTTPPDNRGQPPHTNKSSLQTADTKPPWKFRQTAGTA
jgi:hypothetical protein